MDRTRGSGGMLGLFLVKACSDYYGLHRKPPVTAALIAANTLIYLRPKVLHRLLPSLDQVLFNPHLILQHKDLKRFILSAFYHIGEPHLVYNMFSLLWKGIQLETVMGSFEFASMVAALTIMSQGITLLLAKGLLIFDYPTAYYNEFSAGFSGVLFAMKVVLYSRSDDYTYVQGVPVPSRYAAWAELVLIQMFVPGVSFLGHLGGILAGIMYMQLTASDTGPGRGPLKWFTNLLSWPLRTVYGLFRPARGRVFGRGRSRSEVVNGVWRCWACTFDNSGWLDACEMCGTNRGSSEGSSSPSIGGVVSPEELRRRRLGRFDRH